MAEALVFTLELKSRIDKELAKVRRSAHGMSEAAVKDVGRFQKSLSGTKNTIAGLTHTLTSLKQRQQNAFDPKQLSIYKRVITTIEHKIASLNRAGLKHKTAFTPTASGLREFERRLSRSKHSIAGLNATLEDLRRRKERAFDTKQIAHYNRAIARSERRLEKLNHVGVRRGGVLGRGVMGMLGRLAGPAAIGFAGLSIVKKALREGVELEQNRIAFQTMLGDEAQGRALVEKVNDLANRTPFANSALLHATKTLLNFGFTNEDVLPTLSRLGDVSGGNAERLSSLALVMGQVRSAGKLMGQDLLQFINAGFNPLQEMAKQTGESMGKLKEEMSKGKISYEGVAEAFRSVTSEGGKFHQMMEKQSESMGGKWSTLVGTFSSRMAELGMAFKPAVNGVLDFSIALMGGEVDKRDVRIRALNALNSYIKEMNEVGFSMEERQRIIQHFNSRFGEEVLSKKITIEVALDDEAFMNELDELKSYLDSQRLFGKQLARKEEFMAARQKQLNRIERSEGKLRDIREGTLPRWEAVGMTVQPLDHKKFAESKIASANQKILSIERQLLSSIYEVGASGGDERELLKRRRAALIEPVGPISPAAMLLKQSFNDLLPGARGKELEKINKLLSGFIKKKKPPPTRPPEDGLKTFEKNTGKINAGGRVSKTVNLHVDNLIGISEADIHVDDATEDLEEKIGDAALNSVLRALNSASRVAEN